MIDELLNSLKNKTDKLITKGSKNNPNHEEYLRYKEAEKVAKILMRLLNKAGDRFDKRNEE